MYAPRGWALKKRPLFVLGKVFRAALSLVGLFGLLRSWPQSARTGLPRGWAGLDDCNPDQIIRLVIGNLLLVTG
jgi:hypothetical protein